MTTLYGTPDTPRFNGVFDEVFGLLCSLVFTFTPCFESSHVPRLVVLLELDMLILKYGIG